MSTLNSVVAADGVTVIQNPDANWKIWSLAEIYLGHEGLGKYVPNVGDFVWNIETYEEWKVVAVDISTLVPTLIAIKRQTTPGTFDDTDLLLGVGPGTASDTYRCYIDDSVLPHLLVVDVRLQVKASMAQYAIIFKGSEIAGTSKAISAYYDQAGNLLGNKVPLELALVPEGKNYTIKTVMPCNTTEKLPDNEIVTVVFYNDVGQVVSKRQLLIENTAFIRTTDASQKHITDITLETPFLSTSDPQLIEYPLNVNLSGFNLFGRVHYSDGDSLKMPVDGTKFALFGLQNFVATQIGQRATSVLKYVLSPGEIVYGATTMNGTFMTKEYQLITTKADNAYTVKLFGYPVWIDAVNGYRLEFYLLDLNRALYRKVTPYVSFNPNTPAFKPTEYGISQLISVSLNLRDVDGVYKSYTHTQTFDLVLQRPGSDHTGTIWTIGFEPGQNPPFGRDNWAVMQFINQNLRKLKVGVSATTQTEWLDRMYWQTKPLFNPTVEAQAPTPDWFSLIFDGGELEYRVSQWNDELEINKQLLDSDTLFIKFFKRQNDTDLVLSVSALPIWQES